MTRDLTALAAQLTEDEGRRLKIYQDELGYVTVGVGHNMSTDGISDAICDALLAEDMARAATAVAENWAWSAQLPDAPWAVLVNLCFNMGPVALAGFVHFLAAMQAGDWPRAAEELQNSAWWGQVGQRGPRMVKRLIGGAPA
jgi:lysozyme